MGTHLFSDVQCSVGPPSNSITCSAVISMKTSGLIAMP